MRVHGRGQPVNHVSHYASQAHRLSATHERASAAVPIIVLCEAQMIARAAHPDVQSGRFSRVCHWSIDYATRARRRAGRRRSSATGRDASQVPSAESTDQAVEACGCWPSGFVVFAPGPVLPISAAFTVGTDVRADAS
jgi:hypothetical protein